jgi:selenide,water dikinase
VRLPDGSALLATVDFITPLCDDPVLFGRIAAANSASDVYAMGGRGLAALSIACFPSKGWPMEMLGEMLRGGAETLGHAGIPVIGGHTVDDPEMKIGYAVLGLTRPEAVWRNSTAREGDALLLTKRIGTGILAAAARSGRRGAWWDAALEQMATLNRDACEALQGAAVHAATDVTGFGLAGHAAEMARGAGLTIRLQASTIPLLEEAARLQREGFATRGKATNLAYVHPWRVEPGVDPGLLDLLVDPQTSGGLLIAADPSSDCAQRLRAAGCLAAEIGRVEARSGVDLVVA